MAEHRTALKVVFIAAIVLTAINALCGFCLWPEGAGQYDMR